MCPDIARYTAHSNITIYDFINTFNTDYINLHKEAHKKITFSQNNNRTLSSEPCPICTKNFCNVLISPCGHSMCHECSIKMRNCDKSECVECRVKITAHTIPLIFLNQ